MDTCVNYWLCPVCKIDRRIANREFERSNQEEKPFACQISLGGKKVSCLGCGQKILEQRDARRTQDESFSKFVLTTFEKKVSHLRREANRMMKSRDKMSASIKKMDGEKSELASAIRGLQAFKILFSGEHDEATPSP